MADKITIRQLHTTVCGFKDFEAKTLEFNPPILGCTATSASVTVIASLTDSRLQYSKDDVNWSSSNVFNNLLFATEYTFYIRLNKPNTSNCVISKKYTTKTLLQCCDPNSWVATGVTRCQNNVSEIQQQNNCNTFRFIAGGTACTNVCTTPTSVTVTGPSTLNIINAGPYQSLIIGGNNNGWTYQWVSSVSTDTINTPTASNTNILFSSPGTRVITLKVCCGVNCITSANFTVNVSQTSVSNPTYTVTLCNDTGATEVLKGNGFFANLSNNEVVVINGTCYKITGSSTSATETKTITSVATNNCADTVCTTCTPITFINIT